MTGGGSALGLRTDSRVAKVEPRAVHEKLRSL